MRLTAADIAKLPEPIRRQIERQVKATVKKGDAVNIKINRDDNGKPASLSIGSELEERFAWLLKIGGVPEPVRQYRFAPPRRYKFDFAWPNNSPKIAVEIDGETNHARYHQTTKDAEKRNLGTAMGWRIFVLTGEMVKRGPMKFIEQLKTILQ